MNKIKVGTLAVAFMYTIYHINTVGLNWGNGCVLGLLLISITADYYRMARERQNPKNKAKQRDKNLYR